MADHDNTARLAELEDELDDLLDQVEKKRKAIRQLQAESRTKRRRIEECQFSVEKESTHIEAEISHDSMLPTPPELVGSYFDSSAEPHADSASIEREVDEREDELVADDDSHSTKQETKKAMEEAARNFTSAETAMATFQDHHDCVLSGQEDDDSTLALAACIAAAALPSPEAEYRKPQDLDLAAQVAAVTLPKEGHYTPSNARPIRPRSNEAFSPDMPSLSIPKYIGDTTETEEAALWNDDTGALEKEVPALGGPNNDEEKNDTKTWNDDTPAINESTTGSNEEALANEVSGIIAPKDCQETPREECSSNDEVMNEAKTGNDDTPAINESTTGPNEEALANGDSGLKSPEVGQESTREDSPNNDEVINDAKTWNHDATAINEATTGPNEETVANEVSGLISPEDGQESAREESPDNEVINDAKAWNDDATAINEATTEALPNEVSGLKSPEDGQENTRKESPNNDEVMNEVMNDEKTWNDDTTAINESTIGPNVEALANDISGLKSPEDCQETTREESPNNDEVMNDEKTWNDDTAAIDESTTGPNVEALANDISGLKSPEDCQESTREESPNDDEVMNDANTTAIIEPTTGPNEQACANEVSGLISPEDGQESTREESPNNEVINDAKTWNDVTTAINEATTGPNEEALANEVSGLKSPEDVPENTKEENATTPESHATDPSEEASATKVLAFIPRDGRDKDNESTRNENSAVNFPVSGQENKWEKEDATQWNHDSKSKKLEVPTIAADHVAVVAERAALMVQEDGQETTGEEDETEMDEDAPFEMQTTVAEDEALAPEVLDMIVPKEEQVATREESTTELDNDAVPMESVSAMHNNEALAPERPAHCILEHGQTRIGEELATTMKPPPSPGYEASATGESTHEDEVMGIEEDAITKTGNPKSSLAHSIVPDEKASAAEVSALYSQKDEQDSTKRKVATCDNNTISTLEPNGAPQNENSAPEASAISVPTDGQPASNNEDASKWNNTTNIQKETSRPNDEASADNSVKEAVAVTRQDDTMTKKFKNDDVTSQKDDMSRTKKYPSALHDGYDSGSSTEWEDDMPCPMATKLPVVNKISKDQKAPERAKKLTISPKKIEKLSIPESKIETPQRQTNESSENSPHRSTQGSEAENATKRKKLAVPQSKIKTYQKQANDSDENLICSPSGAQAEDTTKINKLSVSESTTEIHQSQTTNHENGTLSSSEAVRTHETTKRKKLTVPDSEMETPQRKRKIDNNDENGAIGSTDTVLTRTDDMLLTHTAKKLKNVTVTKSQIKTPQKQSNDHEISNPTEGAKELEKLSASESKIETHQSKTSHGKRSSGSNDAVPTQDTTKLKKSPVLASKIKGLQRQAKNNQEIRIYRPSDAVRVQDATGLKAWLDSIYEEVKNESKTRRRVSVFIKEVAEMERYKETVKLGFDDNLFFAPVLTVSGDNQQVKQTGQASGSSPLSGSSRRGSSRRAGKNTSSWGTSEEAAAFMLQPGGASSKGLLYILPFEAWSGAPRGPHLNLAERMESCFPPLQGPWKVDLLSKVLNGIREQLHRKRAKK